MLLDTNVLLTYVSGREDDYSDSVEKIINYCVEEEVNGFVAFHSLSIIWNVARKRPEEERRQWLQEICEIQDFTQSEIPVISPNDFMKRMEQ